MAKPRVFVSSTYYDLKYVRERLERFISAYCFDPILFESDEVFFNPSSKLDESCYNEVENCHIMLLIVGGRYGSLASEQKERYEDKFISITRKEYECARRIGIPVMVFVEQNVFAEYKTFIANKKKLPEDFKFAFVDDIRVFEFISTLEQGAIKIFGKVDDIEHYFSHQIAGMLLSYLKDLQDKKADAEIKNAVDEIKVVSQSMRQMVNSIAEEVLKEHNSNKYDELLRKQNHALIDFFIELLDQNIEIVNNGPSVLLEEEDGITRKIVTILNRNLFKKDIFMPIYENVDFETQIKSYNKIRSDCSKKIASIREGLSFDIDILRFDNQLVHILDLIESDSELNDYFKERLRREIKFEVSII